VRELESVSQQTFKPGESGDVRKGAKQNDKREVGCRRGKRT